MKERLVVFPVILSGTAAAAGTVAFITGDPIKFVGASVYFGQIGGGTLTVTAPGTAGTAVIYGTVDVPAWFGGTTSTDMRVPASGTVRAAVSVGGTAAYLAAYLHFHAAEK